MKTVFADPSSLSCLFPLLGQTVTAIRVPAGVCLCAVSARALGPLSPGPQGASISCVGLREYVGKAAGGKHVVNECPLLAQLVCQSGSSDGSASIGTHCRPGCFSNYPDLCLRTGEAPSAWVPAPLREPRMEFQVLASAWPDSGCLERVSR